MTNRLKLALGACLCFLPFVFTAGYAGGPTSGKPISMTFEGTVTDTAIDVIPDAPPAPELTANVIDAQITGSFGPASLGVLTEFAFAGFCDPEETVLYLVIAYSKPVITFKNGDQLWGSFTSGDMCLDSTNGAFSGSGRGEYTGGTGRFDGARGPFTVTFGGTDLTLFEVGVGFGPIYGEIDGTVILP